MPGMAGSLQQPQILEHTSKSLSVTIYDTKWVPSSARFVVLGSHPRNSGCIQVYELGGTEINKLTEAEKQHSFKCGTFGASSLTQRHLATGDFDGNLNVWDLDRLGTPLYHAKAHSSIVNAIDGCGGLGVGRGAPEIVTCGRDGRVCVWDTRQKDDPVACFEPATSDSTRDCWAVSFGNAYEENERCVLAGYDNGDVKLFDLRTGTVRYETTLQNGVCAVDFDRKDIPMNKFAATTLESRFHVFDARTQHATKGMASLSEKQAHGSTIWGVRHLPQNREVFMTLGGDGSLALYKYSYPEKRTAKEEDGSVSGVIGSVNMLASRTVASQPISCFDWSPDKEGLAVFGSFDQSIRVGIVTKLHKV